MSNSGRPLFDIFQKMILVGDAKAGKTNLLARYVSNTYSSEYKPTIGVKFGTKILEIGGKKVKTDVWDIAGHERFKTFTTVYYRGALAVILVFDLTEQDLFGNLYRWLQDVRNNVGDTQIILVGNKSDLVSEPTVSQDVIDDFMSSNGICHYFPISAKASPQADVETVFRTAAEKVLQAQAASQVAPRVMLTVPKKNEHELNEEEKLLPENKKGTQSGDASLKYNPTLKEVLILRLEKYIARIDGYLNDLNADDNGYDHGFWFFKKSRALSREANYAFAHKLLANLVASDDTIDSIDKIFQNIDDTRADAIRNISRPISAVPVSRVFTPAEKKACLKSGINSTELNEVIEIAYHALRPSY